MSEAPKLAKVEPLDFRSKSVIATLEELLEKAKAGEIRSVGLVFENVDGTGGWRAAIGPFASPIYMVGRLHALATQVTLNDIIEYQPDA